MKKLCALFLLSTNVFAVGLYPDLKLTPGEIDPKVKQDNIQSTICKKGYSNRARDVSTLEKIFIFDLYKKAHSDWPECFPKGKQKCQSDHLIGLGIGGSNDRTNLWPQAECNLKTEKGCLGAIEKDAVDTYLHSEVCAGRMTLKDAQDAVRKDWVVVYGKIKKK
jgi:hypothetical protein